MESSHGFAPCSRRRLDGEPLAYIRGRKDFHAISLRVTRDALIPRPETECLVDAALAMIDARLDCSVLDLGTGSGAIALAIKRAQPSAAVTAVDGSAGALAVARANARALGLEIRCLESDWFAGLGAQRFDLVVCNPPYVRSGDPVLDGALRHEPRQALDGGSDGLDAIRLVLSEAPAHLAAGGDIADRTRSRSTGGCRGAREPTRLRSRYCAARSERPAALRSVE